MTDTTVDPYDPKLWDDAALLTELRKRYEPTKIPPCRVCAAEMSIQSIGGGEPTVYACQGMEDDPDEPGRVRRMAGRGLVDDHYRSSEFIDRRQGGDEVVMELIERFGKTTVRAGQTWGQGIVDVSRFTVSSVVDGVAKFECGDSIRAEKMLKGEVWFLISEAPDEASR